MVLSTISTFGFLLLIGASRGKIYDRCELARELKFVHNAPSHQLATWVCIAEHESQYNTSIIGYLSGDGSADHGIFQINDRYWCSPPGKGYACGVTCAELEDDDISDDFLCAQKIYKEHKTLSGDGFNAWAVYKPYCKGPKADSYIKNCFDDTEGPKSITTPGNVIAHGFFDTAAGKASRGFSTSTGKPFDSFLNFRSPEIINTFSTEKPLFEAPQFSFLSNRFNPSTENPNFDAFFTPKTTTTYRPITRFVPTTTTTTRSNFVPTTTRTPTSNLIIFNPTTSVVPTVSRSSIFELGKTYTSPSDNLFTSSVSPVYQTSSVSYPAPVFIVNGVKWFK